MVLDSACFALARFALDDKMEYVRNSKIIRYRYRLLFCSFPLKILYVLAGFVNCHTRGVNGLVSLLLCSLSICDLLTCSKDRRLRRPAYAAVESEVMCVVTIAGRLSSTTEEAITA